MSMTPIIPPVVPYPGGYRPMSSTVPFTYRSGETYLIYLERIKNWLENELVPWMEENVGGLAENFEEQVNKVIDTVNEALATEIESINATLSAQNASITSQIASQNTNITTKVSEMEAYVDDAVADIIGSTIAVTDPVVSNLLENGALTKAIIDSKTMPVRNRENKSQAKAYPRKPERVTLPAGFGFNPDIPVYFDGEKYFTSADLASKKNLGGTTRYVNSATGANTANTGTSGSPWKTLDYAIAQATAGDTIMVQNDIVYRGDLFNGTSTEKSVNVIATVPGTKLVMADNLTYTLASGQTKTFTAARSGVLRVVDFSVGSLGVEYAKTTSIAATEALEGSFYTDGTNVFIHALGNKIPSNSSVFALLDDQKFYFRANTTDVTMYVEGFDFIGSNANVRISHFINGAGVMKFYGKNCRFLYGCAADGGVGNAVNVNGAEAWFQNCIAAYCANDGFNYHADTTAAGGVIANGVELNCEAHSCGTYGALTSPVQNGSTMHDGGKVLRIGGNYHYTYGTPIADVHVNTKSVNYSCNAWDSFAPSGMYNAALSAQQAGAEIWAYGCKFWGTENDVYSFAGATVHTNNTQLDTKGGAGTLDLVNVK